MRRLLITILILASSAVLAPAALAATQTASRAGVTATFTFSGRFPNYSRLHLTIARSGAVVYDQPVSSKSCGSICAPGASGSRASSVHLIDLDHTGQPNVVLDLFTGGAHCCFVEQVFTFDPGTMTYTLSEHNFGDPGARIEDLNHDGRFEFLTADDRFAYTFTDFAASGLPVQVLSFDGGRFDDVTNRYPALIRRDAMTWLKAFRGMAGQRYVDSTGVMAAWAADQYRLGKRAYALRFLHQQARAGHLNSPQGRSVPQGQRFVTALQRFLRRNGY